MASLAMIALEFCRECLGWQREGVGNGSSVVAGSAGNETLTLNFTNLAAVMEAAGEWCRNAEIVMALQLVPITGSWYVQLTWANERILYGCGNLGEIPELVMCACLEARDRRTAAAASRFKSWRRDFSLGCTRN